MMTPNPPLELPVEPMIDSRRAAAALRLPYYWFSDHLMRDKLRIPHYRIGGLVRYRISELSVWAMRVASDRGHERAISRGPHD
jgi:hypothetical protein